jgi:hypothetical protein
MCMKRLVGLRGEALRQMHVLDVVPLTPDSPFGNLFLKQVHLINRLIHVNRRLDETEAMWETIRGPFNPAAGDPGPHHRFSADEVVVHLRRAMDELIALLWVLRERDIRGDWPRRVVVDSIGRACLKDGSWSLPLLDRHNWLARTLNELANANKHSFVDSDFHVVGAAEPCVVGLALKNNDHAEDATPYVVSLDSLVEAFNRFLLDAMNELKRIDPVTRKGE